MKCSLLIEVFGPNEVLCHTQPCHRYATHFAGSTPICAEHIEQHKKWCLAAGLGDPSILTQEEYEHERTVKALIDGPRKIEIDKNPTSQGRKRRF